MWWLIGKLGLIISQLERLTDTIGKLALQIQHNSQQLEKVQALERQIISQNGQIIAIFTPRPSFVILNLGQLGGIMPLNVGDHSEATVTVLDQFGQPMTGFDFTANPPKFSLSDPNAASLAAGPTPDTQDITGVAAGSEVLTVDVPGVTNSTASISFSVVAAPPPTPVATTVELTTNPDITG